MGALTENRPKSLVEVHGKPILWYVFLSLYRHGFRNFVLPLGYKGDQVRAYIQKVSREMQCNVICVDTGEDTSIAGRVARIEPLLPEGSDFLILNSDTIFDFDIASMYRHHREQNALLTLSSVEVVSSWGLIWLQGDTLVGFDRERRVHRMISQDSPRHQGVVNSGIAWLHKDALSMVDLETCDDFESSLYSRLIQLGRAAHFQIKGSWFPIDTPKDLRIVNLDADDQQSSSYLAKSFRERLSSIELPSGDDEGPRA